MSDILKSAWVHICLCKSDVYQIIANAAVIYTRDVTFLLCPHMSDVAAVIPEVSQVFQSSCFITNL